MSQSFLLGRRGIAIRQGTAPHTERLPHERDPDVLRRITSNLADAYIDFLEGLKYRGVIISAKEGCPDLLSDRWLQHALWQKLTAAICLQGLRVRCLAPAARADLPTPAFLPNSPLLAGTQIIILWLPVPGAVKYNVYLNDKKVGESPSIQS